MDLAEAVVPSSGEELRWVRRRRIEFSSSGTPFSLCCIASLSPAFCEVI
jgi:hypothetical protein